ncbi:MAG: acyl-CoA dehydrogenase family protein [Candidatus Marinimicrobia bacterium]|nr:acyl-CoA dehydrogenase family protein [Candidatus Neomarinimicrobiota bacterium]MCH8288017.1 acyl-CoA dehydrogenase family protein [Candidatus Neomarinimicrobiota bacterium]
MDFRLPEEIEMLRDTAKKFTDQEIRPLADSIEREEKVPEELIKKLGETGLMGVLIPPEYGGGGFGELGYCAMQEEISQGCASTATFLGAHLSIGSQTIILFGSEETKKKYLPGLAKGELIAAYSLSEAGSGSDAAAMKAKAVYDGGDWVLNGTKIWVTNGPIADVIVVYAKMEKDGEDLGPGAFVIETANDGFNIDKIEKKMGLKGSETAAISFSDFRIPNENLLGDPGQGFNIALTILDVGRLGLGAVTLGQAKESLRLSTLYSQQREQFGQPIADFQAIQWMLAEMTTDIYAMESILYRTANAYDEGKQITREASCVKLFCSEALDRIVDHAVQIHGGMGYSSELKIERMYRDSRVHRIFEGTNEIQRLVIARETLKKGGY